MHRTMVELFFFFFNDTATTEIYTLSLHDALPIYANGVVIGIDGLHQHDARQIAAARAPGHLRKKLERALRRAKIRSEEHTSELQSQSNLVCRLLLEKKKSDIMTSRWFGTLEVPEQ